MTDPSPAICNIPLKQLQDTVLDIATYATPKTYRFLNCISFIDHRTISITEFDDLQDVPYAALSYVWRGSPLEPPPGTRSDYAEQSLRPLPRSALMRYTMLGDAPQDPSKVRAHGFIRVRGAEDGDPISILALTHVCTAAHQQGLNYLWMDRLCIIQTSRDDKNWQIRNMYDVYRVCNLCIILPGGVQRIVSLLEETAWIHRAWTLQETVAPKKAVVLFRWNLGSGEALAAQEHGTVTEVVPYESAVADITTIVNACTIGELEFQEQPAD